MEQQQPPPVYLEGLDVFDEYEQRFNDFLRSTPYIDQILQTSKEYRLAIESLNILAVSIITHKKCVSSDSMMS
jgi:hypothetical protein